MYNLQQQAFAVSALSNSVGGVQNDNQQQLEQLLAQDITAKLTSPIFKSFIGDWTICWGPAVFVKDKDDVADNAMYAAQNQSTKDIVVGIAGTNAVSKVDIAEDMDVGNTVPFPGASGAWVAQGTWGGVRALERMIDSTSKQTLLDFLNGQQTGANLIFSGHSLGGALTPVFALDLLVNHPLEVSNFSNVYTYPTAGPTPGNDAFASFYATKFPPGPGSGWQLWNENVWNSLDAVPHAWSLSGLDELPSLYAPIGPVSCIQSIVTKKLIPALNGNSYAPIPDSAFAGTYVFGVSQPFANPACQYAAQALHQHIQAYYQEIIPDLAGQFPAPSFTDQGCTELQLYCTALAG